MTAEVQDPAFRRFRVSPSSESLEAIVRGAAPELVDVLHDPALPRAFRRGSPAIMQFLEDHIRELVERSFADDCRRSTICGIRIISLNNSPLVGPLLLVGRFREFAVELLSGPVSERLVGRLCEVTRAVLCSAFEKSLEHCGYILGLVRHSENLGVLDLFWAIASSVELGRVQDWLSDVGYAAYVTRELSAFAAAGSFEKTTSLLRLICATSANWKIQSAFQSASTVEALSVDGRGAERRPRGRLGCGEREVVRGACALQ